MAVSTEAFKKLGLQVHPDEFERLVEAALVEILPPRRVTAPLEELTEGEAEILKQGGMMFEPREQGAASPLARTAAEYAALLASALTVADAAKHLGVDGSRVRQRLAAHTLYGVKLSSGWRLPRFQFVEGGLLPGFERVAPRLVGLHPVSIARWLTHPHVDLTPEGDLPISPRAWLEMGMDPGTVAALADELHVSA